MSKLANLSDFVSKVQNRKMLYFLVKIYFVLWGQNGIFDIVTKLRRGNHSLTNISPASFFPRREH